jgi:hypothetical protein
LTDAVLGQVQRDRKGEKVDYSLLYESLATYVSLGFLEPKIRFANNIFQWTGSGSYAMYDRFFEDPIKKMMQEEFALRSLTYISSMTSYEYLNKVYELL